MSSNASTTSARLRSPAPPIDTPAPAATRCRASAPDCTAGGRWNPPGVCSTIYLAQPRRTCVLEFDRLAAANGLDPISMLTSPRTLHTIDVRDLPALDLRDPDKLGYVGLSPDDIADDDWTACQAVGHAAYFLEMGGLVAPSATGHGLVIAVFEARVAPDQLTVADTHPLDEATYRAAHTE